MQIQNNAKQCTNKQPEICVCVLIGCAMWNRLKFVFQEFEVPFYAMRCNSMCGLFGDQWPPLEANTVLFLFFFRYISFIINAARFSAVIFDAITFTVDRWLCVVRFSCDLIVWVSFCTGEIERPTNRSNSIEQQTRYGTRLWFFLYSAIS